MGRGIMHPMHDVLAPPPNLPPRLQQYRFWIWLQLVAIRLYVIALRGRLVSFTTATDRLGNVYLVYIGDAYPAPDPKPDPFAFEPSRAFLAATTDTFSLCAHPGERPVPAPRSWQTCNRRPAHTGMCGPEAIPLPDT